MSNKIKKLSLNKNKDTNIVDTIKKFENKDITFDKFLEEVKANIKNDNFYFLTHCEIGDYALALVPLNTEKIIDKTYINNMLQTEIQLLRWLDFGKQVEKQMDFIDSIKIYGKIFEC